LIHEYALAIYGSLLLAVALTWPTLRYPLHTVPEDLGDPARQAWQISWIGHILLTHPQQLWQSNTFFPEPNSLAFGDSLLGYAPVGMLGDGPLAATLRYNILFVLAHALLAVGGYALVRQLGAGRTGAAVAAVAIAYAPWRLAQEGHLDIISAGGIPLALAMLAAGSLAGQPRLLARSAVPRSPRPDRPHPAGRHPDRPGEASLPAPCPSAPNRPGWARRPSRRRGPVRSSGSRAGPVPGPEPGRSQLRDREPAARPTRSR
jgi:hypothetical protein